MEIQEVTVIGAGTMGAGIASAVLSAGFTVHMVDITEDLLAKGKKSVEKILARSIEKEKMTEAERAKALRNIHYGTDLTAASSSQLVIEAATENREVKTKLFALLAGIISPQAILASNTSALKISELAESASAPEQVIGMHFFNPVPAMKLVELVKTPATSPQTFEQARQFVLKLGKEPVTVNQSPGFIVNRLLIPMINEAACLFGDGIASAEDIDKAMQLGANHPLGPLTLADLIGLDVCLAIMETLQAQLKSAKYQPAPVLQKLVREGKLGKKTSSGFHAYPPEGRKS